MKTSALYKLPAIIIGSFLLVSGTVQAQIWYNSSWQYRKAITIDYTKVGAGPHTNFPVLINITDANLQTGAQADFDDILFTSSNGTTKLDHEVESYTSGTGALVAWVEIPSLSSSANTVIYMYYGNAAANAQQNITGTWDASFKGVYHLNNTFLDATSNAFNGTNTGTINATGKISNGRNYVRADGDDKIIIPGLMGSSPSTTISAWTNLSSSDVSGAEVVSLGDHILLRMSPASTDGIFYNGTTWVATSKGTNYAGAWHYLSYTIAGGGNSQKLYVDGVEVVATTNATAISYAGLGPNTYIGAHANGGNAYDFDGTIDEVRVSATARSAGWILTEYNNQNSPSTFYSAGVQACNAPSTASAGADQTGAATCGLTTVTLAANVPTVGTGAWSIISGTGGTVTTPTSATSTFSGTAGTTYTLRWTISNSPCTASTDDVVITFNRNPTTSAAGADQTGAATCGLTTVTLAANAPSIGTGAWSIISGAGGTVATPTSATSTFSGTAGTTYTLRWTISNAPCTASTDDVVITFNRNPTTSAAGADQTGAPTCGLTTVTLAANAPSIGTGVWSIISGTGGTVTTPTSATSTFSGTAGTTYTLRWTISNSPCTASTDDVVITFNRNPTTSAAGADQTGAPTCGLTTVTLAANAPSIGTGVWSIISGAGGTVTTPTSATSTFSGTAGTTYTLRWTISNAPCTPSTDDVIITFSTMPAVSGTATETCVGGSTGTITALANGGSTPYTYSLNAGAYQSSATFTGLAAATYTLNVKSNAGCIASNSVTVNSFAASMDDQNAAVTDTWIGHMYDGTNFSNYIGQFTEAETFNELFGGTAVCFNVVSNSLTRSIYTESFSVKFRMNSTKRGLYVVDLGSDDGNRLTVNGTMVYNNWSDQGFTTKPAVLMSLTGSSSLMYEFYENAGSNQVIFQNLTLVLANTLSTNIIQNICIGNAGTAISGDVYGTPPAGITLSGTGYQWSYSTTPGGARTNITGETAATFTPSAAVAPFNAAGTYYIYRNAIVSSTNNIAPNPYVATNESNAATIAVTAAPAATISYAASPYCSNAGTASITFSGTTGGTYTSTAGLIIDANSGDINLSASTAGTYTVTYTMAATGGCSVHTATTSVTITPLPAATISYTGSPYSQNAGTASVTISGTTGGTYSSTAGLSINATTGAVTLGTSTQGAYVVTYTVAAAGGCIIYTTTANITILAGTKTFTGTGNFSDAARWTDGTLPTVGQNLVIDGTCTVDNNAGTDNIAYGTLVIGTATARTLNWAVGGTNRLNVTDLSHGAAISTLDMTNGGTLIIRVSMTITNMVFTPGAGTIEIQSTMTLLPAAILNNLVINGTGTTVKIGAALTLTGNLTITSGNFNANNFNLSVKKNWTNNVSTTAFIAGTGTVTFNGNTAQTLGGTSASTFNHLTIANTAGNVMLNVNASIAGNLSVTTGTFDLGTYTANRATSGGTLSLSNNTTLKIGGTNTFPANYTTNTLVVASTVEYSGTNQTVANKTYGNLALSSSGGAAVKTFPATALAVVGNFSSTLGAGTSVSFTAAANITITGNVSIGTSTTFNGSSYSHSVAGNWVNSGTFNGNTGTVSFTGPGKAISGPGTQNFNNLTVAASLITFPNSGISLSGNLATISSGSLVQASGGTLLMTGTGRTISGTGISLSNLTVSGTVTTTASQTLTGNISVSGSFIAGSGTITMSGISKTISGAGTIGFAELFASGTITTASNFSISSGLTVSGSFSASAGTVTFTGTSSLGGTANLYNITVNGTSLQLTANSTLGIANALVITAGMLNATSSIPNTVNFNGTGTQNINAISYNNLILSNGNTKTATGAITAGNSIIIGAGTTFNAVNYTHSVYGNWINNGTFTAGSSTVQFLGPATAYLAGATTFNILTSNTSSPTTELQLQSNVTASIVNMTNGIILTGTDTLTITGTRTGNGFINGNIQRTHAFTTGVAYAFEGPNNTINFSSVSSVTSITVSVVKEAVNDFPFGAAIGRFYNISVPAGTYIATLRLHYEDDELNGNPENDMGLWKDSTLWIPVGKTANDSVANYVEHNGLTNFATRWTCSINPSVVSWNGSVSSDWNTAANWTVYVGAGSTPPSAADVAVVGGIIATYQPTISTAVTIKNLVFTSNKEMTLTMASGGSLATGDVQGVWNNAAIHTINAGNQTITVNGSIALSDGTAGNVINLNIGSGNVTIESFLDQTGGANINFTGAGTLSIAEDFHYSSGTFTAGAGTVIYNGLENQHIAGVNYNDLIINKSTGIALIDSTVNIAGDLLISSGTLENSSTINIAGNVTIDPGTTVHNNYMLHIGGNWLNNGTYIATGAHIVFNGSGTQTISASTFNTVIIDKPVGTSAVLTGNVIINGDLTVESGTLNILTFSCDRAIQGGVFTLTDSATYIVGGNNAPVYFAAASLAASSTVIADGTGPQAVYGESFGNLIFRNAGLKTLVSPITVNGTLTIDNGAAFDGGSQTLTLNGNWVNNGTYIPSTSTIVCTGAGKTISGVTTFDRLSLYGSYTLLSNVTFDHLLIINSSGSFSAASGIHVTMNGDLVNSGVLYTLGSTTFTGNVLQTLSLINAVQTVAITVNFNGSISPILNSTSAPQFGFLNINNTGGVFPSVGWTIAYGMTVGSGASFNGGNSAHNILGSITNNGTITSSGTLNFIPSAPATVNLGSDFSSTGTVNFGGAGAMTLAGTAPSFHNVVISNTNAAGITSSANWDISNNFTVNSGSILNAGSRSYTVGGNLSNNGTLNSGTSLFTINGTGTQDIYSLSAFNDLTINKASDSATLSSNIAVSGELKTLSGTVNLNTLGLTVTGTSTFTAGTINNGTVTAIGATTIFGGTIFGAIVNATSDALYLNGSTFNNKVTLSKTGATDILSAGGNTFNDSAIIGNSGAGYLALANAAADIFNGSVILTNTGTNALYVAFNSAGNQFNGNVTFNNTGTASAMHSSSGPLATATYNGNIILNNTSAGGISFGAADGHTTLAATKTISIGATGFTAGMLSLYYFTQAGTTPQALTLTGTSVLVAGPSATFNGNVSFISPQVYLNGGTYNGTAYIEKKGATQNNSLGGNIYNSTTTLVNSSSAPLVLGFPAGVDTYNGNLTLTNTGTGGIYPAFNTAGHQFNGNIILNQTANGGIYFGAGTGTASLATGKTITIGGSGFYAGSLNLARFTQVGTTPQAFTLTGSATLQMGPAVIFNGNVNFVSPLLLLNGCTFNGIASLKKSGATDNVSTGGNIFNGITTLLNSGAGSLDLGNTSPETFNTDLTITNTGNGRIQIGISSAGNLFNGNTTIEHGGNSSLNIVIARNTGSSAIFNGNLVLNCTNVNSGSGIVIANDGAATINGNVTVSSTNGRGILFGAASGTTTLANGFTISAGSFTAGTLTLNRFTQTGTTAQNITLTGTANLVAGLLSQFNGPVNFIAPQLFLNGSQYNNTAILRKTGATDNTSTGGNTFNAATTISSNGSGFLRLGGTTADDFNSHATFIQTNTGLVQPAYSTNCTIAGNLSTAGTATAITFRNTVTLNGTGAQSIISSLSPTFTNLTISNTGNTVTPAVDIMVSGNLSVSNGTFDLGSFTANRITAGGTLTVSNGTTLKIGGANTIPSNYTAHSVGLTSTVEYNGANQAVGVLNSAQNYGHLVISGPGTEITADSIGVRNNLNITAGALNINNHILKIGGSISNSGTFTVSNGTIEMNGASAQSIPAEVFAGNLLKGLKINNTAGVTLAGAVNLTDVLTVSNGALAADGYLTLKSSDTATARVAPITSAAATPISGNVIAERYAEGRRKYRLIASPVTTSASTTLTAGQESLSIWGNWQNSGMNTTPNAGNLITGGSAADGFDQGTSNASLYTYDDVNRVFKGHTTANGKNTKYTPLKAGVAYLMFVYGDRQNSVFATSPHTTVLNSTGTLKTGTQTYNTGSAIPLTGVTGRFTLLGNPFASPINWATIPKTDLSNTYWGFDPNLAGTGGYITVTTLGDVSIQAPYSGTTALNQHIQSGQGFFVKTTGASPVLTIREQDKVSNFNAHAYRTASSIPLLAVNLQYVISGTTVLADGVLTIFDPSYPNATGAEDATKMANTAESMAILNDTTALSINARQIPQSTDTLFLNVSRITKPQYTLQIFSQQLESSGILVFLQDKYLNTLQSLSLTDTNNIVININTGIPASFATDRFRIVFKPTAILLPVTYTSIKAMRQDKVIEVEWEVAEESSIQKYEIERSGNGVNFIKTGEVTARGNNSTETYHWLDTDPIAGNNYYRVRAIQPGGRFFLSKIVVVKMDAGNPVITVFPNPVKNKEVNIRLEGMEKGSYAVLLFNRQGQQVSQQLINHPGGSFTQTIYLSKVLPAGMYYLRVVNEKEKYQHTIIVE